MRSKSQCKCLFNSLFELYIYNFVLHVGALKVPSQGALALSFQWDFQQCTSLFTQSISVSVSISSNATAAK